MQIILRTNVMYNARTVAGISRDELARRMGISSATAFRIENGDSHPSPKFIAALIKYTGRTFEELFDIEGAA